MAWDAHGQPPAPRGLQPRTKPRTTPGIIAESGAACTELSELMRAPETPAAASHFCLQATRSLGLWDSGEQLGFGQ